MVNIMAQSMFGHNVGVWVGVNDRQIENTYINSDGSGVDWLNWNQGEPNDHGHNEDCVEFHTWDGHWNDDMCSKAKPSVCKCPASENAPDDPRYVHSCSIGGIQGGLFSCCKLVLQTLVLELSPPTTL